MFFFVKKLFNWLNKLSDLPIKFQLGNKFKNEIKICFRLNKINFLRIMIQSSQFRPSISLTMFAFDVFRIFFSKGIVKRHGKMMEQKHEKTSLFGLKYYKA